MLELSHQNSKDQKETKGMKNMGVHFLTPIPTQTIVKPGKQRHKGIDGRYIMHAIIAFMVYFFIIIGWMVVAGWLED